MSDFGSFADLASISGNQVEKPKPLPEGQWSVLIKGPWKEHKAKSGNGAMRFPLSIVQPLSDIDADTLAAAEKATQRDYHIDFWMSPDARWRFTEFCAAMGIDQELNLLEMAEKLVESGTPFQVTAKHSTTDAGDVFCNLDNPAPIA